jgi:MFS family permease
VTIVPHEPFWRVRFHQAFAAFKYRNYRLWFAGQLVSLLGTWMQITAQGFLVFELTRSTAYLGYVAFAAGIPPWLFMLYAGVIADRISRRRLMLLTQSCMMILATILAVLTFLGVIQAWHILILAFGTGVANAFDAPARQAFVVDLVGREDLTNAIALNSFMFNASTAVGPAVAGLAYAGFGPAWCFVINAVSFLAVLVALVLMRLKPPPVPVQRSSTSRELKEGLRFAFSHPQIRILLGMVTVLALFGLSFAALIPAWAVRILGGDAATNGFLQSARGAGALLGALLIASLGQFRYRGRLLTWASYVFPCALLAFSFIRLEPLAMLALVVVGVGMIVTLNLSNALIQTLSPDLMRGRIMSIYSLAFFGFMPLGGLIAGVSAEHIGEPLTVVLGASAVLVFVAAVRVFLPKLYRLS